MMNAVIASQSSGSCEHEPNNKRTGGHFFHSTTPTAKNEKDDYENDDQRVKCFKLFLPLCVCFLAIVADLVHSAYGEGGLSLWTLLLLLLLLDSCLQILQSSKTTQPRFLLLPLSTALCWFLIIFLNVFSIFDIYSISFPPSSTPFSSSSSSSFSSSTSFALIQRQPFDL